MVHHLRIWTALIALVAAVPGRALADEPSTKTMHVKSGRILVVDKTKAAGVSTKNVFKVDRTLARGVLYARREGTSQVRETGYTTVIPTRTGGAPKHAAPEGAPQKESAAASPKHAAPAAVEKAMNGVGERMRGATPVEAKATPFPRLRVTTTGSRL